MDENALAASIVASIASVLSAVALPAVVVVIASMFKKEVRALLTRPLRRMKAWGVEAEWDERAGEVAVEAVRAAAPVQGSRPFAPQPGGSLFDRFEDMAQKEPNTAIMAAFAEVEKAIGALVIDAGYEVHGSPLQLLSTLTNDGIITEQTAESVRGMAFLRNLAAHRPDATAIPDRALDYLAMADATLFAARSNAAMATAARFVRESKAGAPAST